MTTFDDANPTLSQFLFWKFGKAMSKRERSKASQGSYTPTWIGATIRFMMHIAGFACLTYAGFLWHPVAGFVVAGLSFFVLSKLSVPASPQSTQPADPMATRR